MKSGKILIVDDDELQGRMLERIFSEEGYAVQTVTCGKDCLEIAQADDAPDLILLDLNLPDLDGIDVLIEIRKVSRPYQLPVIINSGESCADRIVAALEVGANDFIIKPADTTVFIARVKVAMKLRQSTHELLHLTRHQVMQETIGAACHHVAQPMTALQTGLELLIQEVPENLQYERPRLIELLHWAREASEIIHKLQNVHSYKTINYYGQSKILDIQTDSDQLITSPCLTDANEKTKEVGTA